MTYDELLLQKEWWFKCNEILNRDRYTCQDCGTLGFHNENNFMKLSSVTELNDLLRQIRIKDLSVAEFVNNKPITSLKETNINLKELTTDKDTTIYDIDIPIDPLNNNIRRSGIFNKAKLICDKTHIAPIAAKYHMGRKVILLPNTNNNEWLLYLETDKVLSDTIYVNIENFLGSIISYDDGKHMGEVPLYRTIINITLNKTLISISSFTNLIKGLNIHHEYYIHGKKPWEYPNEALITLCANCHHKRHQEKQIPLYTESHHLIKNLITCCRCGGTGYLPQYHHVENGICFNCWGEGIEIEGNHL